MMGWDTGFGGMGWSGWWWPLVMVLFWVAVIGLSVWLVGTLFNRTPERDTREDGAVDTLKRRYARGEITRQEYEEGRRLLSG